MGSITNNDEMEYMKEIENLVSWCQHNDLSVSKMKELLIVFKKWGSVHAQSTSMAFTGDSSELQVPQHKYQHHTDATATKAQYICLYFLKSLRKF